jgi:membrane-bound lytic murein transglycosylase MltF
MQHNLCLLQNSQNNAMLMINVNHPDKFDYQAAGYSEVSTGTKKYLESVMEEVFDSLDMPEDERIFLQVK